MTKTFFTTISDGNMNDPVIRQDFLDKNNLADKQPIVMEQVHGNAVIVVDDEYERQKADGLITQRTDVALFARSSDCVPILIFDPVEKAIGAVHAGWRGTFKEIIKNTINELEKNFNSKPQNLIIHIGPSIGICCYEVSNEMVDFVKDNFGQEFVKDRNIDLSGINTKQLIESGVQKDNVHVSNICTKCNDNFFSYRRDSQNKNFASIIAL